MRLWSIHPSYLDSKGLVACWREALLAQSILIKGEFEPHPQTPHTRLRRTPYYNHPQLLRFKQTDYKYTLGTYLYFIWEEAKQRGYCFDKNKIQIFQKEFIGQIPVTKGQLRYEYEHLQNKLYLRDRIKWEFNGGYYHANFGFYKIKTHPLFQIVEGPIEIWEKVI